MQVDDRDLGRMSLDRGERLDPVVGGGRPMAVQLAAHRPSASMTPSASSASHDTHGRPPVGVRLRLPCISYASVRLRVGPRHAGHRGRPAGGNCPERRCRRAGSHERVQPRCVARRIGDPGVREALRAQPARVAAPAGAAVGIGVVARHGLREIDAERDALARDVGLASSRSAARGRACARLRRAALVARFARRSNAATNSGRQSG